jgi:CheY-like chemotaxis protein
VSIKILVVDDDPSNLALIRAELEDEHDYRVTTAVTGEKDCSFSRRAVLTLLSWTSGCPASMEPRFTKK